MLLTWRIFSIFSIYSEGKVALTSRFYIMVLPGASVIPGLAPDFSVLLLHIMERHAATFPPLGKSGDNLGYHFYLCLCFWEWCMWLLFLANRELCCFLGISQGCCIRKLQYCRLDSKLPGERERREQAYRTWRMRLYADLGAFWLILVVSRTWAESFSEILLQLHHHLVLDGLGFQELRSLASGHAGMWSDLAYLVCAIVFMWHGNWK